MAKVQVFITLEMVKPAFSAQDLETIIAWVKTNVTEKIPENATDSWHLQYNP